jgi:hypothetical protein
MTPKYKFNLMRSNQLQLHGFDDTWLLGPYIQGCPMCHVHYLGARRELLPYQWFSVSLYHRKQCFQVLNPCAEFHSNECSPNQSKYLKWKIWSHFRCMLSYYLKDLFLQKWYLRSPPSIRSMTKYNFSLF